MRSIALRLTAAFLLLTATISILSTTLRRFSGPLVAPGANSTAPEPWWAAGPLEVAHAGHSPADPVDLDDLLPAQLGLVSLDELAAHEGSGGMWVAIDGVVWDLTDYAEVHPGGPDVIKEHAGTDVSRTFNAIHPPGTIHLLAAEYRVGVLE
ncbi:hypothetical protein Q8F55_005400 [Vanrija albida]|uniref:Cytochrome b5 heme-binding domain-containing protein n=1 Tax=Vanrija albida TaxID=181172 RepID=A0ABR3Q226_9TREE